MSQVCEGCRSSESLPQTSFQYHQVLAEYKTDFLSDVANAWISKSGLAVISSGYIGDIIENEDEFAAALGHEIAHTIAGHNLESYCMGKVDKYFHTPLLLLAFTGLLFRPAFLLLHPPILSVFASLVLRMIREQEADYISLLLMTEAGFDLTGAVSLWTKYDEWEDKQWREINSNRKWYQYTLEIDAKHPHVSFPFPFLFLNVSISA